MYQRDAQTLRRWRASGLPHIAFGVNDRRIGRGIDAQRRLEFANDSTKPVEIAEIQLVAVGATTLPSP